MSENSMASNLVAVRGNRTTATILGWLEQNLYDQYDIPKDMQRRIRSVVLDNINGYKDLVIDIVKSDTAIINDIWVQKLDAIHDEIRKIK